jgi:hypothetical protein
MNRYNLSLDFLLGLHRSREHDQPSERILHSFVGSRRSTRDPNLKGAIEFRNLLNERTKKEKKKKERDFVGFMIFI